MLLSASHTGSFSKERHCWPFKKTREPWGVSALKVGVSSVAVVSWAWLATYLLIYYTKLMARSIFLDRMIPAAETRRSQLCDATTAPSSASFDFRKLRVGSHVKKPYAGNDRHGSPNSACQTVRTEFERFEPHKVTSLLLHPNLVFHGHSIFSNHSDIYVYM